jgi:Holliday junction resolvasome RuvABC ATP-dependent DNA helicase subunit
METLLINHKEKGPQLMYKWFDEGTQSPSPEVRRRLLDPDRGPTPENPRPSPYYGFVGNRTAVNKLLRIDFDALGHHNHLCRELAVAFVGQPGSGKTCLARRHAKANELPLVELSPRAIKSTHDIFEELKRVWDARKISLVEVRDRHYIMPPTNVFIDEVHALSGRVVQSLLKATEYKDAVMVTEKGVTVDCYNIHWMIATTDRGKLFDAFDTRFTKVVLNLYTKDEITTIVQNSNPHWNVDVCKLVAHYCSKVPREALAFAREMQLEQNMNPAPWEEVAAKIAADNEIDEFGMSYKRLAILKALGQKPIAANRLPTVAGCKIEELEKFVLPWMMESTPEQLPLVGVTNKGYIITPAGVTELERRKIHHNGPRIMAA